MNKIAKKSVILLRKLADVPGKEEGLPENLRQVICGGQERIGILGKLLRLSMVGGLGIVANNEQH